jgi:hypothetical protein
MNRNSDDGTSWWLRGVPRTRRAIAVFFTLLGAFFAFTVVTLVVLTLPQGVDEVVRRVLIPFGIVLLFVLMGLLIFPAIYIPGRIRVRVLRKKFPNALVVLAPLSTCNQDTIRRLRGEDGWPSKPIATTALVVDDNGLEIWAGSRPLQKIASLPWADIGSVGVTELDHLGRTFGALDLRRNDGRADMYLSIGSRNWLVVPPYRPKKLEPLASRLDRLASRLDRLRRSTKGGAA